MYYLSRSQAPVPAEAPCNAHVNERKQWEYDQRKHKEAIDTIFDRKPARTEGETQEGTQERKRCQALSRRFAVDAKRAEIGRENRKLVEKLTHIAKSSGQCAPPGSLTGYGSGPQPGSLGGGCTTKAPNARPPVPPGGPGAAERSRSLNDNFRRKERLRVDQDNASMVRRILAVKSTFSPSQDERAFQYHKRTVNLLQRLPDGGRKHPRSLPPLRPPRPSSYPEPARGLEALMLPSDLHRCQSGPGAFGREDLSGRGAGPTHATTAPAGSLPEPDTNAGPTAASEGAPLGSQTYSFGGFDTYASDSLSTEEASQSRVASQPASGREGSSKESLSQNTMPRPAVGPGPEEEAGRAARGASAFGKQDSENSRRQWIGDNKEDAGGKAGVGISSQAAAPEAAPAGGKLGLTGMSSVSELQYADDWDEYSFNSSGNVDASRSAAPSRGPSSQSVRSGAVPQTEGNAPPPSIPEGSATQAPEASQSNAAAETPATEAPTDDFSKPPDFGKKAKRPR